MGDFDKNGVKCFGDAYRRTPAVFKTTAIGRCLV